jgi:anaerobic magnesium-protoporphyrin IX monomethyl ester cyclase
MVDARMSGTVYPWQQGREGDRGKILLVYPGSGMDVYGINVGLPLSCLYLGTVLQMSGYRVEILDERTTSTFEADVVSSLQRERPLLVGISSMTGSQIQGGLRAAGGVKKTDPSIPVVWGGVHPTLCPESTLRDSLCDYVVLGEGEVTLVELADCLREGVDPAGVAGIGYKQGGRLCFSARRPLLRDLDAIPRPDYGLLRMEHYFTKAPSTDLPQLQLVTSRGCPFDCEFCYNLRFNERKFRCHSAERVVSDIRCLVERFGVRALFIEDDYFFGNPKRVEEICDLLLKAEIEVFIQVPCRIDYLYRQPAEMIDKLHRAGFKELWIGVESGSQERLKQILKRTTLDQVREVNRRLSGSSVYPKYGFMAGFPGESREETLETVTFIFELLRENPGAGVAPVAVYTPYPGTTLYDRARSEHGMAFPETLEGWSQFHFAQNNNPFLSRRQRKLIGKINVISRFFERRAFERFCDNRYKRVLMLIYDLYYRYLVLRLRRRFFACMPEIPVIRFLERCYVRLYHRAELARKLNPGS